MWEILEEIKELQFKERGCVPILRGVSPVGRDEEGRLYTARTCSRSRPNWRRRDCSGSPGADMKETYVGGARVQRGEACG